MKIPQFYCNNNEVYISQLAGQDHIRSDRYISFVGKEFSFAWILTIYPKSSIYSPQTQPSCQHVEDLQSVTIFTFS